MNIINSIKSPNYIKWLIFAFFILILLLPLNYYKWDEYSFSDWLIYLKQDGILNIYNHTDVNYMPLYLYILNIFQSLFFDIHTMLSKIYLLKSFTLIFDLGGIYLIYLILKHYKLKIIHPIYLLINIVYFYNTLFWGQIDAIHSFFILLSIFFAIKNNVKLSLISFVLALNFKLQSIIFSPVLFLILLPKLLENRKQILKIILPSILLQLLILSPYIFTGKLNQLINVVSSSVDFHPYLSMSAFNIWFLIEGPMARWTTDNITYLGIEAKSIGLILFILFAILSLIPLIKMIKGKINNKGNYTIKEFSTILLSASLLCFSFFFFNTQMHERYTHPALLLLIVYSLINSKYLISIIFSIIYFLNIEKVLLFLPINHLSLPFFGSRFISILYLLFIAYLFYEYYSLIFGKRKKSIRNNINTK